MSKTSITVQEETLARFNELKQELNEAEAELPDVNADHFLNSLMDTWDRVGEVGYGDTEDVQLGEGYDEIAKHIAAALSDSDVGDALQAIEERTGRIERAVEALGR